MSVQIAVIDDYQDVARSCADWSRLPEGVDVTFFHDHCETERDLLDRLEPFEIVGVMRERSAFPREVLTELPNLRLLASTGRRNAAIDMLAAEELGIVLDEQQTAPFAHRSPPATGKWKRTRVPRPSFDRIRTLPPCNAATWRRV